MLRANDAAFIGTADQDADCRGIRRKRQLAATANRAALPHLEWTARPPAGGDFPRSGRSAMQRFGTLIAWSRLADGGRVRWW